MSRDTLTPSMIDALRVMRSNARAWSSSRTRGSGACVASHTGDALRRRGLANTGYTLSGRRYFVITPTGLLALREIERMGARDASKG